MTTTSDFELFRERMRRAELPDRFIEAFEYSYHRMVAGESGLIRDSEIAPVDALVDWEELDATDERAGLARMPATVMLKLNGGLGTSMGLTRAKSLLPVREDLTFLDVLARQALAGGFRLLFMNSFNTHADSLDALAGYRFEGDDRLPLGFVQHRAPKIRREDLKPVSHPKNPQLEWYPPGHGDLYTALGTRGVLERLIAAGIDYLFVSNADNLGAVVDPKILGYMVRTETPFLMEVAPRTAAYRKGGHLARRRASGRLMLRELAQCPPNESELFGDIERYRFFNTNNLWIHVPALAAELERGHGFLRLPIIRNEKTVDPNEADSTPVIQLETAMGAALELFEGAQAIRVPRRRFAPVKTTSDLILIRSDRYRLDDRQCVVPVQAESPTIDLDPRYYRSVEGLDRLFPSGPPGLSRCTRLSIRGPVRFGRGVEAIGDVELINESAQVQSVADGRDLSGTVRWGANRDH